MRILFTVALSLFVSGCASIAPRPAIIESPKEQKSPMAKQLESLPPLNGPRMTVAVYGFTDKTGQRKTVDAYATFSSAVTQGAESWLIDGLRLAGNGKWFQVLERASLDDIIKERQLISQTRESFLGRDAEKLTPMIFAGIIAQGGIIGYDTNILTGGAGASVLGISGSTQYRKDVVTVSLRFISVQTGEVLLSVAVTKTITSVAVSGNLFKFYDHGTTPIESELGLTANEPNGIAVRSAIDQAVIEIVKQGEATGLWKFKDLNKNNNATEKSK
jgi:curli production assembly/transport component CsgG